MIELRAASNLWMAKCDLPSCFYARSFENQPAAILELDAHKCPTEANGPTHYSRDATMTLVEQLWVMMDEKYEELVQLTSATWFTESDYPDRDLLRGNLRGLAEATAVFMTPHFATGDDIAAEVVKRAEKRAIGESYDTPGLGSRIYETKEPTKYALKQQTVNEQNKLIDPEVEAKLLKAYKSGQFSLLDLAEMFKMDVRSVNAVIANG